MTMAKNLNHLLDNYCFGDNIFLWGIWIGTLANDPKSLSSQILHQNTIILKNHPGFQLLYTGLFLNLNGFSTMYIVPQFFCILSLKNKIKTRGDALSSLKIEMLVRKGRTFMVAYTAQYKWYSVNTFENICYDSRERWVCLHLIHHSEWE